MIDNIINSGVPVTDHDIVEFERQIGLRLPAPYKQFLLEYNGGEPTPSDFIVSGRPGLDVSNVQVFFRLNDTAVPSSELSWNYLIFRDRIPRNLLPIANSDYGDVICISCAGKDTGAIYIWDHEMESVQSIHDGLYKVADSFDGFSKAIFEYVNPDETEEERIIRVGDVKALRRLLMSGYDVEKMDKYGRTLIENAAIQNQPALIQLLFEHGANLRDSLSLAEQNVEFFKDHKHSVDLLRAMLKNREQ